MLQKNLRQSMLSQRNFTLRVNTQKCLKQNWQQNSVQRNLLFLAWKAEPMYR
nr:MAG TPA: hypothetical protein [Caudoviricetes sp.]